MEEFGITSSTPQNLDTSSNSSTPSDYSFVEDVADLENSTSNGGEKEENEFGSWENLENIDCIREDSCVERRSAKEEDSDHEESQNDEHQEPLNGASSGAQQCETQQSIQGASCSSPNDENYLHMKKSVEKLASQQEESLKLLESQRTSEKLAASILAETVVNQMWREKVQDVNHKLAQKLQHRDQLKIEQLQEMIKATEIRSSEIQNDIKETQVKISDRNAYIKELRKNLKDLELSRTEEKIQIFHNGMRRAVVETRTTIEMKRREVIDRLHLELEMPTSIRADLRAAMENCIVTEEDRKNCLSTLLHVNKKIKVSREQLSKSGKRLLESEHKCQQLEEEIRKLKIENERAKTNEDITRTNH